MSAAAAAAAVSPKLWLPRAAADTVAAIALLYSDRMVRDAPWPDSNRFRSLQRAVVEYGFRRTAAIRFSPWTPRRYFWLFAGSIARSFGWWSGDLGVSGPDSQFIQRRLSSSGRNHCASIFDQIASSDFQTDWGTRGNAASASSYNPNSYSSGSVWATGTSEIATAFWAEHRPATALPIWRALIPWSSLDSLGHIHEALAGDYYHEEVESVPEQAWSSSSFFSASVNGLLGLQIDGGANRITFAPHLPPSWNAITLRNLHVGLSEISLKLSHASHEVRLEMQNQGTPVQMVFDPEIPLGAKLGVAQLDKQTIAATLEENPQDSHAKVEFSLPHGSTVLTIGYVGGVAICTDPPPLMVGESSRSIKITGVNLNDHVYRVDFDYLPSDANSFDLRTGWAIKAAQGANYEPISPSVYRFCAIGSANRSTNKKEPPIYQHGEVAVTFER